MCNTEHNIVMISQEKIDNIMSASEKDIKTFSFNGIEGHCKVSHVHDADTCRIIFYFEDNLIRVTVRLSEIDAPEIKPDKMQTPFEIETEIDAAKIARDRLCELTKDKLIYVKLGKNDKYKRPLCDLYMCDGDNKPTIKLQDILLKERHVIKYTGGKKVLYKDWNK